MRILNLAEIAAVTGAGTPAPPPPQTLYQTQASTYSSSFNGVTTTVTCTPGTSLSFTLVLSSIGKWLNGETGFSVSLPPDCVTTILNTKTGDETVCHSGSSTCTFYNAKTHTTTTASVDANDSGAVQMAELENISFDELWASVPTGGGGSEGGGGGSGGGGGGGGGDGGDPPPEQEASVPITTQLV